MNKFKEGQRVVVKITKPDDYAGGAVEAMDGRAGVVEKVKEGYVYHPPAPGFLVQFDEPAPAWHSHSMPMTAFWFEAHDLVAEAP